VTHQSGGGRFRVVLALVCGAFICAGAWFLKERVVASADLNNPRTFVAALPLRHYQDTPDTDGDGLKDWLEELLGSDPKVSDAGGNATPSTTTTGTPFVPTTETEKFAVTFFDELLREHGGDGLNADQKKRIINTAVSRFSSVNRDTLFTRRDATIVDDQSEEAIHSYANSLGAVIIEGGANTQKIESEIVLVGTALAEDDPSYLADLPTIRAGYTSMVQNMQTLTVPEPMIEEHLILLNAFQAMVDNVRGFEKTFDDPLVSFARFKRYLDDVKAMSAGIQGVRNELERMNIIYNNSEPGSFFFSIRP
jgi:hypothetical protein